MKGAPQKRAATVKLCIWDRLIPADKPIPDAVITWMKTLAFSEIDVARINELALKAQDARLSVEESDDLELFEQISDMLSILKAKCQKPAKIHVGVQ